MAKPEIFGIADFQVIAEMNWTFKPVPWMVEIYDNEITLIGAVTSAVRNSWSTIAVANDQVIAVGGLLPKRYWNGRCIEAEAWAVPCVGYEKWPIFLLKWAKKIHELQRTKEIPRIEAFTLWQSAGGNNIKPVADRLDNFLHAVGFRYEGYRRTWLKDYTARCSVLLRTNFQEASKMH